MQPICRPTLLVALLLLVVSSRLALPSPARADATEQRQEEKMGKDESEQIAKSAKFSKDKALVERVSAIGQRCAAIADVTKVPAGFGSSEVYPFKYTFHVIDEKEVNAFSLPGGYIYVYKGMLDLLKTDDQIAGVLGHEIAHAAHHHVSALSHQENKMSGEMALGALAAVLAHVPTRDLGNLAAATTYAQQAQLNNHYSEAAEEDADHTGMIYMQKAGYNPVGMLSLLQTLKQVEDRSPDVELGFLQDHPLTSDRLASARRELSDLDVRVDAHTLRMASGSMIASVAEAGTTDHPLGEDIKLNGQVVCRLAPGEKEAAALAVSRLNELLDQNLQLYEVKAVGPALVARDQTLVQFTEADIKAQAGAAPPSADSIAVSAAKSIRTILWSQSVTAPSEQEIDVAPLIR